MATSQADDIAAINDYFNRTAGKTAAAKTAKESWNTWFNSLSFVSKSFNSATLGEATQRRIAFDAANGDVQRLNDGGLTPEEQKYFASLPSADVTGKTPEEAKAIIAAAAKEGAKIPVPTTLLVAQIGSLRQGSKGDAVKRWQEAIGIQPADGIFGPGTRTATIAFQKQHGIAADGVVGPASWTAAQGTSSTAGQVVQQVINAVVGKPQPVNTQNFDVAQITATAAPVATMSTTGTGRPVLRLGTRNSAVSELRSYLKLPSSDIYDAITVAAVKKWQSANGLVADGVFGAASWAKYDSLKTSPLDSARVNFVSPAVATMTSGLNNTPNWVKWFLGVITLGAIGYGVKEQMKR